METQRRAVQQIAVEKEVNVMLRVVDEPERRDGTGFQPQITHHALGRGERQFSLMQPRFEVVDRERAVAVEADQIVPVALVIAEKEVFAVFRPVVAPVAFGQFDRGRGRVEIEVVGDVCRIEPRRHGIDPFAVGGFIPHRAPTL